MNDSITKEEIEEFNKLEDIQVVFDVGVRESTDYLELRPNADFHLFEPVESTFFRLKGRIESLPSFTGTVHLNNYALGDNHRFASYNFYIQAFMDGEAKPGWGGDKDLEIKTLDWYIEENKITRIDFLKIDTEGYDLKVLQGGKKAVEMARYIQFEHWNNIDEFKLILGDEWIMKDIGSRNIFCARR